VRPFGVGNARGLAGRQGPFVLFDLANNIRLFSVDLAALGGLFLKAPPLGSTLLPSPFLLDPALGIDLLPPVIRQSLPETRGVLRRSPVR
jgi:hypothetical protein